MRDWQHVALDVDGFHELIAYLCKRCTSEVRDAVRERLQDLTVERVR